MRYRPADERREVSHGRTLAVQDHQYPPDPEREARRDPQPVRRGGWELVSLVVDAWQPRGFLGGGQQASYRAVFKAPA